MTSRTSRQRRLTSLALAIAMAAGASVAGLVSAPTAHADEMRDKEYWLADYGISKAWDVSKGSGVKVAIIDSGVDGSHQDLAGAVVGGTDVSGSGSPDGRKGIGAAPEHGTLVASVLAGRGHAPANSTAGPGGVGAGPDGVLGVAPEAQLLTVSTWLGSTNPSGIGIETQIPDAVRWAVDNGAKVINMSLGSPSTSWPQSWDSAFLYAEQKDVVIVAAAGNRQGGNTQVGAPATIPGVLAVAGLDRQGKASIDSSSQGISIAVAAPSENLVGGFPGGLYADWSGTSGAAPIVSGVAALIRSRWPQMSAKQVINRIVSTAKDAGAPGVDSIYGFGVMDAEAALKADVPETAQNPLGTIAEWISIHRRGQAPVPATAAPAPSAPTTSVMPDPTVPVAEVPSQLDNGLPMTVVIGFSTLFVLILAGAAVHLYRASRNPAPVEDAETGPLPAAGEQIRDPGHAKPARKPHPGAHSAVETSRPKIAPKSSTKG